MQEIVYDNTDVIFSTITQTSGSDITLTPPSTNIILAAGHVYQVCTSVQITIGATTVNRANINVVEIA